MAKLTFAYADFRGPKSTTGFEKAAEMRLTGETLDEVIWSFQPRRICGRELGDLGRDAVVLAETP